MFSADLPLCPEWILHSSERNRQSKYQQQSAQLPKADEPRKEALQLLR